MITRYNKSGQVGLFLFSCVVSVNSPVRQIILDIFCNNKMKIFLSKNAKAMLPLCLNSIE